MFSKLNASSYLVKYDDFIIRQKAFMLFWLSLVIIFLLAAVSLLNVTTSVSTHPVYITITNILLIISLAAGLILIKVGKYQTAVTLNTIFITFRVVAGCLIKYESMILTGANNNIYFMFGIIGFTALFGNRWLLTAATIFILMITTALSVSVIQFHNPPDPNYIIGTLINVNITIIILSALLFLVSRVTDNSLLKTEDELNKNVELSRYLELKLKEIEQQYSEMESLNETIQQTSIKLLKANEDLLIFKRFADASGQGLLITKLDYEIIYANPGFSKIVNSNMPEGITGTSLRDYYDINQGIQNIDIIAKNLSTSGQWSGELILSTCDQKQVPTIQNLFYITGNNNKPLYFAAVITDISSQKKSEDVLRKSEERYRLLVETMNEGLFVMDRDGIITFVNNSLLEILGYTYDEMMNRMLTDFLFEERKLFEYMFEVNTAKNVNVTDNEIVWIKKDGTIAYTNISPQPVFDDNNIHIGNLGIVSDITEKKNAEAEKQKIQSQLHQVQKMEAIGTLAGGIAHDFNNILTAIIGYGEILKRTIDETSPGNEFVDEILRAAQRSAALTRQLLAFSKKQVLQKEFIDINSIVENMNKMLCRLIGEEINLITSLNANDSVLYGDQIQIEQVIMNLVLNSMQAMHEGGTLIIETGNVEISEEDKMVNPEIEPGQYISIDVRDNGIGMEKEILQNIFEPFYSNRKNGKGTGLGLAVVYGIVKQHNGLIKVNSQVGQGTEFTLLFRAEDFNKIKPVSKNQKKVLQSRGNGEKILVVEDQDQVRSMITYVLDNHGYTVYPAESIGSAKSLANDLKYELDLVFCDVVLPDGNGLDLVEVLTGQNNNISIIMSSGYTDRKSHMKIIKQKGYKYIQKPYTEDILISSVYAALQ